MTTREPLPHFPEAGSVRIQRRYLMDVDRQRILGFEVLRTGNPFALARLPSERAAIAWVEERFQVGSWKKRNRCSVCAVPKSMPDA